MSQLDQVISLDLQAINQLEERKRARLINSLSGFKSANLVGTQSKEGVSNLALISSAVHLGASPALMGFVFRPDTVPRDTLSNIRENEAFTLNHVNSGIYQKAHQTSARYPAGVSEFEKCGLTKEYLDDFDAPFVRESTVRVALHFLREIPITENGTHFVVGAIQKVYFPKNCLDDDGFLDIEKAGTIAVSGLDSYHSTRTIARLSYAKPDTAIETIKSDNFNFSK